MRNRQPDKTFSRWLQSRRAQTPRRGVSTPASVVGRGLCDLFDERGQAIVIIALAMIALIAFAGLVFDGGTAYAERRRMQNAAEAGALAGAYKLAFGGSKVSDQDIYNAISDYTITRNGQQRYGGQVTSFFACYITKSNPCYVSGVGGLGGNQGVGNGVIPIDAIGVWVTPTTTFNTFFMNVLGIPVGSVSAQAKAIFGPPTDLPNNLLPIMPMCRNSSPTSIQDCGFDFNKTYNLWDNCLVPSSCPGNFGWANWWNSNDPKKNPDACSSGGGGGGGSPLLCEDLLHPATMVYTHNCNPLPDTTVSIGDCVDGLPGIKNSSDVNAALDYLWQSKIPITVPIWGSQSGSGSGLQYNIVTFATFVVTGYLLPQGSGASGGDSSACQTNGKLNGSGNCIVGYFVNYAPVKDGELCQPPCSSADTGTYTVSIIGP